MNEEVYQILCRNIEVCAMSIQSAYQALKLNDEESIKTALLCSVVSYKDYCKDITKEEALNMLLNGEKILKEINKFSLNKYLTA